jgi:hypothetical protein
MRRFACLLLLLALTLVLIPLSNAQEKVNLEYKFTEGQTIYVLAIIQGQLNLQLPQSVQQQGVPPAFPVNMALIASMKTLKTYSDGAADIEVRLVDGRMETMGQVMPFLQQMTAQAIKLRMGKKGNLIKLLTPLPTAQQNLLPGFDPSMMIQSLLGFSLFPEEAVGVGDKWEKKMELNLPFGKMNMLFKMSLTDFVEAENQKLARIKIDIPSTPFTFAIPFNMGMPGAQPGGGAQQTPTLQMSGKMEVKTYMLFDYAKGQVSSQVGTLKITTNVNAPQGAQGPAGGLSMDINMKFKITFSEKKPTLPQNLSQIQIVVPEEQKPEEQKPEEQNQ